MYADGNGNFQTQDPDTCALMLGEVARDNRTLSLSGKGAGTLTPGGGSAATRIEWEDGSEWTRVADPEPGALKAALQGALGTTPVSRGPEADSWFIPDIWRQASLGGTPLAPVYGTTGSVDPWAGWVDLDGNRSTLATYSPAAFDATVAVAIAIDAMLGRGEDYGDGVALFEEILSTSFEGLSGPVAFNDKGDRADLDFEVFSYSRYDSVLTAGRISYHGRGVSSARRLLLQEQSGPTVIMDPDVDLVFADGAASIPDDGACEVTNGAVCSGVGTCVYGPGVCVCLPGFSGTNCQESSDSLGGGAIAGIVIGCVVAASLVLLLVLLYVRKKRNSAWVINYEDLTFGESIGEGSFGVVFLGTYHGTDVAIKRVALRTKRQKRGVQRSGSSSGLGEALLAKLQSMSFSRRLTTTTTPGGDDQGDADGGHGGESTIPLPEGAVALSVDGFEQHQALPPDGPPKGRKSSSPRLSHLPGLELERRVVRHQRDAGRAHHPGEGGNQAAGETPPSEGLPPDGRIDPRRQRVHSHGVLFARLSGGASVEPEHRGGQ